MRRVRRAGAEQRFQLRKSNLRGDGH
jgi:hypothetical protein